jgi:membrane peptidoglycan carboxypeptidase
MTTPKMLEKLVEEKRITQEECDAYVEYLRVEQENRKKQTEKTIEMATKDLEIMKQNYKNNGMNLTYEVLYLAVLNIFHKKDMTM